MIPKAVADELKKGRPIQAEQYSSCTIYFSDIVGFTKISGASSAVQVGHKTFLPVTSLLWLYSDSLCVTSLVLDFGPLAIFIVEFKFSKMATFKKMFLNALLLCLLSVLVTSSFGQDHLRTNVTTACHVSCECHGSALEVHVDCSSRNMQYLPHNFSAFTATLWVPLVTSKHIFYPVTPVNF